MVRFQERIVPLVSLFLIVHGSSYCYGSFSGQSEWPLYGLEGTREPSVSELGSSKRQAESRLLTSTEEDIPEFHKASCTAACILVTKPNSFRFICILAPNED